MKNVPGSFDDLLEDSTRAFAYLATLMSDGTPQVTPVWFNVEGDYFLINTVLGRIKDKNMRSRRRVAFVIADPSDPYRYLQIRGSVAEITTEGAEEHIDTLNFKYHGDPVYPRHSPESPRVIYKIKPDKIQAY